MGKVAFAYGTWCTWTSRRNFMSHQKNCYSFNQRVLLPGCRWSKRQRSMEEQPKVAELVRKDLASGAWGTRCSFVIRRFTRVNWYGIMVYILSANRSLKMKVSFESGICSWMGSFSPEGISCVLARCSMFCHKAMNRQRLYVVDKGCIFPRYFSGSKFFKSFFFRRNGQLHFVKKLSIWS